MKRFIGNNGKNCSVDADQIPKVKIPQSEIPVDEFMLRGAEEYDLSNYQTVFDY